MASNDKFELHTPSSTTESGVILGFLEQLYNFVKTNFESANARSDALIAQSQRQSKEVAALLNETRKIQITSHKV
jgi:hypothetical protein